MRLPHPRRPQGKPRLAALLALGLAASAFLSSCVSEEDTASDSTQPASGDSLLPSAEGKVEYPVTVETSWGEVTVEERPERIVAGSWRGELSWLLALGVSPVAVEDVDWAVQAVPWAEENLAQPIEHTWTYDDLAMEHEAIAAADPDLIFAGSMGTEPVPNLTQLQDVAPVLAQPETGDEYAGWRANLLLLGEVLDLQDRAETVIAEYDGFFEDFQEEHPEYQGKSIAILGFHGQNELWYGNSTGSSFEELFTRMGFARNPNDQLSDTEAISPELVGKIEGDVIMIIDYSPPEDEGKEYQELIDSPLFQSNDAVKSDNVLLLSSPARTELFHEGELVGPMAHPSVAYDDPIGSPQLVEMLAPLLTEEIDG